MKKTFNHLKISSLIIVISILFCDIICSRFPLAYSLNNFDTSRKNRGIVFPVFTVLQFSVGLAVPAQVPNRTVLTNLGITSNLPLPSKVNQLYSHVGKTRQLTHDYLYEFLESTWNWSNSDGKECILKTICQVSSLKTNEAHLIGQVLQLLFSPSSLKQPVAKTHYMMAEQVGKASNTQCSEIYPSCSQSILDLIIEH